MKVIYLTAKAKEELESKLKLYKNLEYISGITLGKIYQLEEILKDAIVL